MISFNEGKICINPREVVAVEGYSKLISVDSKWNGSGNIYDERVIVMLRGGHAVELMDVTVEAVVALVDAASQT